ncbi:Ribonuclease P protein subunit p38 [Frankliniella fusca]|uniref:Ribonuclease P protein subunit p38 n=1 Tax=Frankliniella fusca TaxID=407009 RepID=A0AAE1HJD4_9NEOP|nr:Ribonuclease P protein subunit p38 [Frankliniella fusca]
MSEIKAKTLSERQQRQSLSGPKKGSTRTVRTVLAKPYVGFWPLADLQSEEELLKELELLLPAARKVVSVDDRKLLRGMQGKKMKESRDRLTQEIWERNPGSRELRSHLALGVNDVSRGLEENNLASILISNEADPPILTKHLVILAAARNVPHLVLQNLKASTKKCLDFSTLAIGFKKSVADKDNHFYPVHLKTVSVFKIIAKSSTVDSSSVKCHKVKETNLTETEKSTQARSPYEIYLTRSSKKYRTFIPGKGIQKESNDAWSPYISLSSNSESAPMLTVPKEILGSSTVADTCSFLQKVRESNQLNLQTSKEVIANGQYLSPGPNVGEIEVEVTNAEESVSQVKSIKRYFTNLAPLKVKRIQGNPMKQSKKQKKKV